MQTCGVNRRGVRMYKLKMQKEGFNVEEGEDAELESGEEEVVSVKGEVSTAGWWGEGEEDEGEEEVGEEGVAEAEEEIGIETKTICDIFQLYHFLVENYI